MKVLVHQLKTAQLVFWRSREAAFFIFIFPLLLFLLLGSVYNGRIEGHPAADALLAGLLGYGAANTAFAGIAIALVIRRESGLLKRLRATPLPQPVYFAAVLASTLIVFTLQTVCLFVMGRVLFGTAWPTEIFSLALTVLLGVGAFAGLGFAAASLIRSAEGSSAVVNLILLPLAFLSGSFGSTRDYPQVLQWIADFLPLEHYLNIVDAIYLDKEHFWTQGGQIAAVAAWGLAGYIVAARYFRWEPRER